MAQAVTRTDESAAALRWRSAGSRRRLRTTRAGDGLTPDPDLGAVHVWSARDRSPSPRSPSARRSTRRCSRGSSAGCAERGLVDRMAARRRSPRRRSSPRPRRGAACASASTRERNEALAASPGRARARRSGARSSTRCPRSRRCRAAAMNAPARRSARCGHAPTHVRGARGAELPPLLLRPGDLADRHLDADGGPGRGWCSTLTGSATALGLRSSRCRRCPCCCSRPTAA